MASKNIRATLSLAISAIISMPTLLHAQALEEVVVTAQRRVQSLQEVPISIEAVSGDDIQLEGFRDMTELANFTASVYIDDGFLSQDRSVRGFGTSGNTLTLEQAVPIFVDGVHFGRPSQVRLGFLDVEQVEILKGPQPVFFGMNASAGAFNIQSRGPTQDWEGYVDTSYGNNATVQADAAIGGPITNTLGIRFAGKYESSEGYLRDIVHQSKLGGYKFFGGRVMLEWSPAENFQARLKFDATNTNREAEGVHTCFTDGTLVYARNDPGTPSEEGNERSVYASPPKGAGWVVPVEPVSSDCFGTKQAVSPGGPYYTPPVHVHEEFSNTGMIDIRQAVDYYAKNFNENTNGFIADDVSDTHTGYLNLVYQMSNGIEVNSLTAFSHYEKEQFRDNSWSPFLLNPQDRKEMVDQWSSELRFTSPLGSTFEWMLGMHWQIQDNDMRSTHYQGNFVRGIRSNRNSEDQEWKTAFATLTYNFLDSRASIDVGGRYTDIEKHTIAQQQHRAQWLFDVTPCAVTPDDFLGGGNFDPETCPEHSGAIRVDASDAIFVMPGADTDNLWTFPWLSPGGRNIPSSWRGGRAAAIGLGPDLTQLVYDRGEEAAWDETLNQSEFDPQVTLRFRFNPNHSIFFRWAQSFKAAGFDSGVGGLASTIEDFQYASESNETFELGAKGTYWGGRARYDVTLFNTVFDDLQVSIATGNLDDPFINANAGQQRARGVEFSTTAAVSEQMTLNLSGSILDGEMTDFPNAGCTDIERLNSPESGCLESTPGQFRIDRTGFEAPKSPDWKFVLDVKYWMPVLDDFKTTLSAKGYISDGFITSVGSFSQVVKMNQHEDLNLTLGFGDMDNIWSFSLWGRNLLEAGQSYNEELDIPPTSGILNATVSRSDYMSYGVKYHYNFR